MANKSKNRNTGLAKSIKRSGSNAVTIPSSSIAIGLVLLGAVIYLLYKKGNPFGKKDVGKYNNLESWDVSYNADGLPTKIEIHREATRT